MPQNFKQRHQKHLSVGRVRQALRKDACSQQQFRQNVIGRPIIDAAWRELQQLPVNDEARILLQLESAGLVHLARNQTRKIVHEHGSSQSRIQHALENVSSAAVGSLIISRESLQILPFRTDNPDRRRFAITSFPLRAYRNAVLTEPYDLRDEQYDLAVQLSDFYADDPSLWFGVVEGPAKTDEVEEVVDLLEDAIPTHLTLGAIALIPMRNES